MLGLLKIFIYFFLGFLCYGMLSKNDRMPLAASAEKERGHNTLSVVAIVILSAAWGIFSITCGGAEDSDRTRYINRFEDDTYLYIIRDTSKGLYAIYLFLHLFTNDARVLIFITAFVFAALTYTAYNLYPQACPGALLLICVSLYFTCPFYMFKQCYAVALVALALPLLLNGRRISGLMLVLLAVFFHSSALIALAVYIMAMFFNDTLLKISSAALVSFVLLFTVIDSFFVDALSVLPQIYNRIYVLFDSNGSIQNGANFFSVLEGLPFYAITIWGYIKRKDLSDSIDNYNILLFFSLIVSLAFLASFYAYSFSRIGLFFMFPSFVLASNLKKASQVRNGETGSSDSFVMFFIYITLFADTARLLFIYLFQYGGF